MLSGDLSGFLIGGLPDDLAATTRKFATAHGLTLHDDDDAGATAPITAPTPALQEPEPEPPDTQDTQDTQDAPPQVVS